MKQELGIVPHFELLSAISFEKIAKSPPPPCHYLAPKVINPSARRTARNFCPPLCHFLVLPDSDGHKPKRNVAQQLWCHAKA